MYFFLEFYLLLVNEISSWYYDFFWGINFYLVQLKLLQNLDSASDMKLVMDLHWYLRALKEVVIRVISSTDVCFVFVM